MTGMIMVTGVMVAISFIPANPVIPLPHVVN